MVESLDEGLARLGALLKNNPLIPLSMLLPLIFNLKGKPLTLEDSHFMMEPQYKFGPQMARRSVLRCGRQIGKSVTLASLQILLGAVRPYTQIMTVTPLFEQVRKFSSNYVRPLLVESSIRSALQVAGQDNSVLQRSLANGSNLFYGYAGTSADRLRGVPLDALLADEVQDIDATVLPVIEAGLDASELKLERFSGTPKTFDNTIQQLWNLSSQAHWVIPCEEPCCRHHNTCRVEDDLLGMLGDRTLVCSKCKKPVDSRKGWWMHQVPSKILSFTGYHVPQVILPIHYARPVAWAKVLETLREKPKYVLYNECLGESLDTGLKLLTEAELKTAAVVPPILPRQFKASDYVASCLGVDWGGKGKEMAQDKEDFISNTAVALVARRADGRFEVPWGCITPYAADHAAEARIVLEAFKDSHADYLSHDATGAGNIRQELLTAQGLNLKRIIPFTYSVMTPNKPIVFYQPPERPGVRVSYTLDKTRSLLLLIQLIKAGYVLLPKYEKHKRELEHLLALYEETMETPRGKVQLVKRLPKRADDFAHAINFGVMAICHWTNHWPKQIEELAKRFADVDDEPVWGAADLTR